MIHRTTLPSPACAHKNVRGPKCQQCCRWGTWCGEAGKDGGVRVLLSATGSIALQRKGGEINLQGELAFRSEEGVALGSQQRWTHGLCPAEGGQAEPDTTTMMGRGAVEWVFDRASHTYQPISRQLRKAQITHYSTSVCPALSVQHCFSTFSSFNLLFLSKATMYHLSS